MKILFLNFLRLGDLLMMSPVLNAYRKKFPQSEFHYLCFREFQAASQVLGQVDQWHFLSRKRIQESAADSQQGLLGGVDLMKECFDRLDECGFDRVVNLSHTRFSALAMSLISAPYKDGVYFEEGDLKFSSLVFKEMDEIGFKGERHYLDWYRKGFGFDQESCDWSLPERPKERQAPLEEGRRLYLFQTLSSDLKKSWSMEKWVKLFKEVKRRDPFARLKILCAPFEADDLQPLSKKSGVDLLPTNLIEAFEWIRRADYLVTVDTSLKHLANGSPCRVIELCLGSSDFRKQSIYKPQALILTPKVSCHPCSHSELCPLEKRVCSLDIGVEDVVQGIRFFEEGKNTAFKSNAYLTTTLKEWSCRPLNFQGGSDIEKPSNGQAVQGY